MNASLRRRPDLQRESCPYAGVYGCGPVLSLPGQSRLQAHIGRHHPIGECSRCGRTMRGINEARLCLSCVVDIQELER